MLMSTDASSQHEQTLNTSLEQSHDSSHDLSLSRRSSQDSAFGERKPGKLYNGDFICKNFIFITFCKITSREIQILLDIRLDKVDILGNDLGFLFLILLQNM